MAEVVHNRVNSDPLIQLKLVCEDLTLKSVMCISESKGIEIPMNEGALEYKLDIDELHGLLCMCTRPTVKLFLTHLLTCFGNVCKVLPKNNDLKLDRNRKWSDIVAGRFPHTSVNQVTAPQPISTIVSSRYSQPLTHTSNCAKWGIIKPPATRKRKHLSQNWKSTITVIGDSHARGIADELLHRLDHSYNITGLVKPNAGLSEMLNSARKELNRSDNLIVFGGSNDCDKQVYRSNITSLANFLNDSQNTNIILVEVPLRHDIGIKSSKNELILKHNRTMHKIAKNHKHVKLISITPNREYFTRHGFHLNRRG